MARVDWKTKAQELARKMSVSVCHWNPGDNLSIKVSLAPNADYFGITDIDLLFRTGSWKEACIFLQGFTFGVHSQMQQDAE